MRFPTQPHKRLLTPILAFICLAVPGTSTSQEQYFVDETSGRLPPYGDISLDGDLGDVDGNGNIDLVISNSVLGNPDTANLLLINSGDGVFSDSTENQLPRISLTYNHSTFCDIERDGDLDIYVSNANNRDYLLVNDALGNYGDESERIPLDSDSRSTNTAYGDIDTDLDLDIVVTEYAYQFNRLLLNNGNGFFSYAPPSRFPSGQHNSLKAAFGDVDGDFDLDAVIANEGEENVLMINDGDGFFTNETSSRLPATSQYYTTSAIFGDVDGDGDLDIFVTNAFLNSMNNLLINDGSGYFSDQSDLRLPAIGDISSDASFGDIDNDGDLDLIVANDAYQGVGYTNRVYINDGNGYFADETQQRLPDISLGTDDVVLGDVDMDGDLDLLVINKGEYPNGEQNRLFINQSTPDSFPPTIPRTYHHPDTGDTTNPYLITTTVWDNISVVIGELNVSLFYRSVDDTAPEVNHSEFMEIPMLDCGGYLYRERIPDQSSGAIVAYYIKAEDRMGNISFDPPNAPDSVFSFLVDATLGIGDSPQSASLPKAFSLSQNYPNPFNPSTTIDYSIPDGKAVPARLKIFDVRGHLIRTLLDTAKEPGRYSIHWDGRNDKGEGVGSGVYLYRIEAGDFTSTKKMILTR